MTGASMSDIDSITRFNTVKSTLPQDLDGEWNTRYEANNRRPTFALPNELLHYIVEYLPRCSSWYGEFCSKSFPAYRLSQTCHRWRSVAISAPAAWRAIPYNNEYWWEECSRRAGKAPLQLVFQGPYFDKDSVDILTPFIQRAGQFTIFGDLDTVTRENFRALFTILSVACPHLTRFDLEFTDDVIPLPTYLFASNPLPQLADLRLTQCNLAQASHILRGPMLTTINVTQCTFWDNIDDMVATFSAMPALESFYSNASDLILDPTPSSTHPFRCARMKHMYWLEICGGIRQGAALLQYLMLPLTCRLLLTNEGWPDDASYMENGGWVDMRNSLKAHLADVPASLLPSSDVDVKETGDSVNIIVFCKLPWMFVDPVTAVPAGDGIDPDDGYPAVSITIEFPLDLFEHENELADIVRSIPLIAQSKSLEGSSWLNE
ncbi:hypothetical protein PENSPDRAFT_376045 [Peniophora sp. CONT]|nr:hypothetical protein PENSPDRAFT_376045 [Peniophora sp. CONT]